MFDSLDIGGPWLVFMLVLVVAGAFLLGRRTVRAVPERQPVTRQRAQDTKRNRLLRAISIALLLAGVGVLLLSNADEIGFEARRLGVELPGTASFDSAPEVDAAAETSLTDDAGADVARSPWLSISALGISVPIGTEQEAAMRRGAFLQAGSARPGELGNVVLAGHRRRDVFTLLHRVEKGDIVIVNWEGQVHRYRVAEEHLATPTDTKWIRRAGRDRLTMYTCIPRFLGNKRTVVVAYPVDETSAP